jgi:hypothetical protein
VVTPRSWKILGNGAHRPAQDFGNDELPGWETWRAGRMVVSVTRHPRPTARTMNHAMRLMTLSVLIALQPGVALAHAGLGGFYRP